MEFEKLVQYGTVSIIVKSVSMASVSITMAPSTRQKESAPHLSVETISSLENSMGLDLPRTKRPPRPQFLNEKGLNATFFAKSWPLHGRLTASNLVLDTATLYARKGLGDGS